jgi:XRE family aerobic/anaerobic benzoate catabolism transcriptional regulator
MGRIFPLNRRQPGSGATARHAPTNRSLAEHAGVSERYLAKLEGGSGNASILVLRKLAVALCCEPVDLLSSEDVAGQEEWAELQSLLRGKNSEELRAFRQILEGLTSQSVAEDPQRTERIALVGLRGAGKSTPGRVLAEERKLDTSSRTSGRECLSPSDE